jgi:predicted Zn-dependent peptidase
MFTNSKLPSGLSLITDPIEGSKTTTVLAMIATGSKYETREQSGLSHFLEHMFFKGTTKRPNAHAISSELDKIGAEFNAFTSKEYTGYYVKVASDNMDTAIDVVSDMLNNPLLDGEEIKRESGVIVEEVNMYLDNPMWFIEDLFEDLLYGDTPAGWSTIGTKENIKGFTREDFVNYYQSQYVPGNSIVIIAGQVPANPEAWVTKYFNTANDKSAKAKLATTENQTTPASRLHYKKTDQSHLSLGVRTFACHVLLSSSHHLALGGSMTHAFLIACGKTASPHVAPAPKATLTPATSPLKPASLSTSSKTQLKSSSTNTPD